MLVTPLSGANITKSTAHGITTRRSKNMVIQYVRVTNTSGHCIRLQHASNISLFNVSILEVKDNGIETTMSENVYINQVYLARIHVVAVAIQHSTGIKIKSLSIVPQCSFILYSVYYIRIENMTIVNSAGMALIATIISDLSVSSARIHDAISIGNSSDTALNNVSANTSISINHCNRTTFNNIHLENVTSMHGIWIYMCVNTTFANTIP